MMIKTDDDSHTCMNVSMMLCNDNMKPDITHIPKPILKTRSYISALRPPKPHDTPGQRKPKSKSKMLTKGIILHDRLAQTPTLNPSTYKQTNKNIHLKY